MLYTFKWDRIMKKNTPLVINSKVFHVIFVATSNSYVFLGPFKGCRVLPPSRGLLEAPTGKP